MKYQFVMYVETKTSLLTFQKDIQNIAVINAHKTIKK